MPQHNSSTQVRYFVRDDGTSTGRLPVLERMLTAKGFDFEEAELVREGALQGDPEHGDEMAITIYCPSVAEIYRLGNLLDSFERENSF